MLFQERVLPSTPKVDTENGIVRDVKVCGLRSLNNRTYPESTLRAALPMYEDVPVFIDHQAPDAKRSYKDKIATIRNVRYVPGVGVKGDLHVNLGHPLADQVLWDAMRNPLGLALSHNAEGESIRDAKTGNMEVTRITSIKSVDLVSRGATVAGLFESHQEPKSAGPFHRFREAKSIKQARVLATRARFTGPGSEPSTSLVESIDNQAAATINPRVAVPVPPIDAPLSMRIRRFQRS